MKLDYKLLIYAICIIIVLYICNKQPQKSDTKESVEEVKPTNSDATDSQPMINTQIDSVLIKKLKPFFRIKKDEFDTKTVWYTPKSAPNYINSNGFYCYFSTYDGRASNLRFKFQYSGDDWLFINFIEFSVDGGESATYIPEKVNSDNDQQVWEWFDDAMTSSAYYNLTEVANSKISKIKINGRQYNKVITVSASQKKSLKQTFDLFRAMGGTIN